MDILNFHGFSLISDFPVKKDYFGMGQISQEEDMFFSEVPTMLILIHGPNSFTELGCCYLNYYQPA